MTRTFGRRDNTFMKVITPDTDRRRKTRNAPTHGPLSNGASGRIPPLHNGDHLTVAEFERRYEAMPPGIKAELINGVVYMASPLTIENHGDQHGSLSFWLGYYRVHTPGVQLGLNSTLKLLLGENQPQPDALMRILPEFGGLSTTIDGYVVGGAELAAEVSASTVAYDLHEKLLEYERNGVLEYLVWSVHDRVIDWFQLKTGKYHRLVPSARSVIKSRVFPGLWLDVNAILEDNMARVLEVVQQGIASPEHQRFVKKLQAKKK